jgi:proteasome lid subunit RPN8/RPN11
MSEVKFATWSVPESPLTIQYSLVVIEEIRQEVSLGFQKMARGGIEVGGILYGRRDGRSISILAVRPVACEHALGPSFQLSGKDRAGLEAQLTRDQADTHLEGMICVGLFVSHTRTEIALSEADLELFNTYFEAPWQVVMVVRPGRAGSMRAGFFMRESDGAIRSEACYLEFNFPDRLAGVLDRPKPERGLGDRVERRGVSAGLGPRLEGSTAPTLSPAENSANSAAPTSEKTPAPRFAMLDSSVPSGPRKARWPWLLAWILALVALTVFGLRYFVLRPTTEPISLAVLEREGQLQIAWSHTARPVAQAVRGTVEISDGGDTKRLALTPADLQRGNLTYQRHSGDVEIRLIVEDEAGEKTQEASRFLGKPPEKHEEAQTNDLETKRSDIDAEVTRLRQQNAEQATRIQQLERIVKIMQTRAGEAPPQ